MKFTKKIKIYKYLSNYGGDIWENTSVVFYSPDILTKFTLPKDRLKSLQRCQWGILVEVDWHSFSIEDWWPASSENKNRYTLIKIGSV